MYIDFGCGGVLNNGLECKAKCSVEFMSLR